MYPLDNDKIGGKYRISIRIRDGKWNGREKHR